MGKKCAICGNDVHKNGKYCQSCYEYLKNGGSIHPLPPLGEVKKDERGYVICHICGKAYKRLGSHTVQAHNLCIAEYKEKFGLCANARTTEDAYHLMMHNYALANDMDKQLIIKGYATRIQKGDGTRRKGKQTRLQESLRRKHS